MDNQSPVTVGRVVGVFKSTATRACLEIANFHFQHLGRLFQKNYHERVLRDDDEMAIRRRYIVQNPLKWHGNF